MKISRPILYLVLSLSCAAMWLLPLKLEAQQGVVAQSGPGTLQLAGLRERVQVRRDERGIPYVEANNEADLYFAQGYVTASDRLWQMDLLRRTIRGELSEIFGKTTLDEDKRRRTYGFAGVAEAELSQSTPQARAVLEAYARGVNAYIDSRDAKSLPPEIQILQYRPRPWAAADSLLIVKLFAETLNTTWTTDIMREALASLPAEKREALLPETSPLDVLVVGKDAQDKKASASPSNKSSLHASASEIHALRSLAEIKQTIRRSLERVGLYAEDRAVSNNWVVSGKRTASGKPLLANDPHLPPSAPSIWYMMHLSAPGLRVAGVTAPGLPGIVIGHNERIAWGFTNVGPDVQDLYREKFDQANPRRYMTPTGWREAEVRREEIKVRKSMTDTATETVPLDVMVTRHGPIIFEKNANRYALRWTALDPKLNDAEGFFAFNRARNWREFRAALSRYTGPMQNVVYADVEGHIGYYATGRVPTRKSGDGSVPYDGSTDAGEWTGMIPFDKLPHLFDPPAGFIVTANQRIVGRDYPYFLTHEWSAPYRARRIHELLQAKQKLTAEDFRAIQGDTYSIPGVIFAREVVKMANESATAAKSESWTETVRLLESWDGNTDSESRAALLAVLMRDAFRRRVVGAALGPELAKEYSWANVNTFIDRVVTERPRAWLPKEFNSYLDLIIACEADARAAMTKQLGADESQWKWGRYQQMRFPHPLAGVPLVGQQFLIAPLPQNGSTASVNVGRGVSMRLIADTSNWDHTRQGIPLGESGNPSSPHWKDQLEDWLGAAPRTFPFTEAAVAKAAKQTLVLEPATRKG